MTAKAQEDHTGKTHVTTMDFIKAGLPASLLAWVVIVTLGYGIMILIGY